MIIYHIKLVSLRDFWAINHIIQVYHHEIFTYDLAGHGGEKGTSANWSAQTTSTVRWHRCPRMGLRIGVLTKNGKEMSMFGDVGIETPPRYCKYDYVYIYIYMYCICTSYMIYLMIFLSCNWLFYFQWRPWCSTIGYKFCVHRCNYDTSYIFQ